MTSYQTMLGTEMANLIKTKLGAVKTIKKATSNGKEVTIVDDRGIIYNMTITIQEEYTTVTGAGSGWAPATVIDGKIAYPLKGFSSKPIAQKYADDMKKAGYKTIVKSNSISKTYVVYGRH